LEAELDRSPSLPPEPASWITDWAEYSGTEAPRSASTPPPRTSGFVRIQAARTESVRSLPDLEVTRLAAPPPEARLGWALGPGLSLIVSSALLTLVDARTEPKPGLASELRPPTWIAGALCVAGLCLLLRGLWRFADSHDA
jgi:hypothetical protein